MKIWCRQHEKDCFGAEEMKIQCSEHENEGFGAEESMILGWENGGVTRNGIAAGKYAGQPLEASCASYAKGLLRLPRAAEWL